MKTLQKRLLTTAAVSSLMMGSAAHAQDAAPAPGGQLEEIVVTAQRREERLMDVPVSITALTGGDLERRQITDVKSIAQFAPGLNVTSGFLGPDLIIGMRGIAPVSVLANVDTSVGVYVNGQYIARTVGSNVAFVDMERVEALRGPQGTLFGRNTIGGALNIVSRRPSNDFEGSIKLGIGNYDGVTATGIVNLPIVADKVAARIAYDHAEHSGYGRNVRTGEELSDQDDDYVRVTVKADLTDQFTLVGIADYFTSSNNPAVEVPTYFNAAIFTTSPATAATPPASFANFLNPGGRTNSAGVDPRNRGEAYSYNLEANYDFGAAQFKSITGFRHIDFDIGSDLDGTPAILSDVLNSIMKGAQVSQEFQLSGTAFDDRLTWIGGLYYFNEDITNTSVVQVATVGSFLNNTMFLDNTSKSAFAQVTYAITPEIRLTGGIRYVEDTREITYYEPRFGLISTFPTQGRCLLVTQGLATDPVTCLATPPKAKFDYTPWTIGLDYKPNEDLLLYAKVSKGFRSGGFQQPGQAAGAQFQIFGPENVISYEGGVKATLFDGRVRFTGAGYHSVYHDIQMNVPYTPPGQTTIVLALLNAGEARINGAEFDLQAVFGRLRFNGSLGLVDAKFTGGPLVGSPFYAGISPPETTWSAGADYTIPTSVGDLVLRADYSWQSKMIFYTTVRAFGPPIAFYAPDQIDAVSQGSYGVANAQATLELADSKVTLTGWVRNLTDKYYRSRVQAGYVNGWNAIIPGAPRTYGVSVLYKF